MRPGARRLAHLHRRADTAPARQLDDKPVSDRNDMLALELGALAKRAPPGINIA